jgi:eukaryotic-like serine/threonine-protein kinase
MLTPGNILQARYEIRQLLGQGGFGAVYRAYDMRLKKDVAIKEIFDHSPDAERQFEFEAQLLAGLRHPVLPTVSDHFVEADGQYLVMDYVPGEHLGEYLARQPGGRLSEGAALALMGPILGALEYLHRDIKPDNIRNLVGGRGLPGRFWPREDLRPGVEDNQGCAGCNTWGRCRDLWDRRCPARYRHIGCQR